MLWRYAQAVPKLHSEYVGYSEANYSRSVAETTSPLELIDARFALEPQIVRLAVLHGTEQDIGKLEEKLRIIEEAGVDPIKFSEADESFHNALADCTKNSLLIWMAKRVNEVRGYRQWAKMRELTLTPDMIQHYNAQHRAIVEAIRSRDAEGAANTMKAHLASARRSLVETSAP
jgi:DNA-binding FadR family transcriptional regulator